MTRKILNLLILFLSSRTVLLLYFSDKLALFIHPRYLVFSAISATVGLLIGAIGLMLTVRNYDKKQTYQSIKPFELIIKTIFLIVIVSVPNWNIRPLSSSAFAQRSIDVNNLDFGSDEIDITQNFMSDTRQLEIGDWIKSINRNPDPKQFVGKKLSISGFVYLQESELPGSFTIARFIVTCCAVDARPVGLPVKSDNIPPENSWVRVNGEFAIEKIDGQDQLVIISESIEAIDIPNRPYIY